MSRPNELSQESPMNREQPRRQWWALGAATLLCVGFAACDSATDTQRLPRQGRRHGRPARRSARHQQSRRSCPPHRTLRRHERRSVGSHRSESSQATTSMANRFSGSYNNYNAYDDRASRQGTRAAQLRDGHRRGHLSQLALHQVRAGHGAFGLRQNGHEPTWVASLARNAHAMAHGSRSTVRPPTEAEISANLQYLSLAVSRLGPSCG